MSKATIRPARRLLNAALALCFGIPTAALSCEAPQAVITDIELNRYYTNKESSVVDPNVLALNEASAAPLKAYLTHVLKDADAAVASASDQERAERAACAIAWLTKWASGHALLGNMSSKQASHRRNWDMTGIALAYLKVKSKAQPADQKLIEDWLKSLAVASRAVFDDPGVKRNNHWYWLGLGMGAVGLAANDSELWNAARGVMHDATSAIGSEGMLPMELARGKRALHYHAFSVTPLVVLAELAASRGENWYEFEGGALHHLVSVTVRGLLTPQIFETKTGDEQDGPVAVGGGWLYLYESRFPDRLQPPLPDVRVSHRWLGGDVRNLQKILKQP